ncbi:hypothetical protein VOLCADRAFT_120876 [Volvox carteri f. nagariensis]|uniref:START domain-containing protein n=1 Tax=Volvox carteri f. nagariensis TaxID=3068 RepID=D8TV65_VOLCA|nr:uncharacterized protein VOLCADRAFT_120876 [Volvox carteri f. nagariensis]EFJ48648.1 hypothetical protein VOLCADRAFT_120876 [Volvox carteri f. nagariensis]|eukprot:XP_002950447.1 hypothetical protein VOLCADRAFT_120876 [Volvox carteri f. nagariensis]
MSTKQDVSVPGGMRASLPLALLVLFLYAVLAGRGQISRASVKGRVDTKLFRFVPLQLGSPAQWMVAFLGLFLYPALSRTTRMASASPAGAVGSSVPSIQNMTPSRGPGSHSIELEPHFAGSSGQRAPGGGLFKRLRRVLSEGRAQARRLCGKDSLRAAVSNFSRRRSFISRSSKSEDIVSSRLSMDSSLRSGAQQNAGGGGAGRRGLLQRKGSGGCASGPRWQPSMSRITSGQHLVAMAPSESSMSSATAGKRLEILSYNGFQAVDCLSHEMTDALFSAVRQVVTDAHLLQFGAMIGEASAELALSQAGSPSAVGSAPASLFGPYDRPETYRLGWELVVEEHKPGLHYWAWRRHLRKGLFMYKSKTVYETATTAQITDFTYDVEFRRTWDESVACQLAIAPPALVPASAARQAAGPCGVSLAEADARSSKGIFDTVNPAVEVVNVYFEDPCVPSGIVNLGIRRALWPMVQKAEAAFRDYLLTRVHGNLERPPPERPLATDALGVAMGCGRGADAARAAAADADAASCMGGLPSASGLPWRLASPYVLLYRGYMALWRGGRGALLSALGCCMSLWCNSTGLIVGAMGAAKSGLRSAVSAGRSVRDSLSHALAAGEQCGLQSEVCTSPLSSHKADRVLALAMWPWERLLSLLPSGLGHVMQRGSAAGVGISGSGSVDGLQTRSTGGSSSGVVRLSSHPLTGPKQTSFAQGNGGSEGTQSPRGGGRRARAGLARRCALLAVKVAKVAGAGLLLGRAARTEKSAAQPPAPAAAEQQQQIAAMATSSATAPGRQQQQQQRRQLEALRRTVPGQRW